MDSVASVGRRLKPIHYVLGIGIFSLLFKFGGGLHYTLLSVLGEKVFPLWAVGFIVGGASLFQLILDVPAGFILDRFGYVKLLRIFTFVFAIAAIIIAAGITPFTYILTVFLAALGWLFFGPGVMAYILSTVPRKIAGRSIGFVDTFMSVGIVLSALAMPFVVNQSSKLIGIVLAVLILVAFFFITVLPKEKRTVHEPHENESPEKSEEDKLARHHYYIRRNYLHKVFRAMKQLNPASTILAIQTFASGAFYGMVWFVVPLVIAQGLSRDLSDFSLIVFDLSVVFLGALFGKLADTVNKRMLVIFGLLIFGVSGAALGFNLNAWFLLLGFMATAGDELSALSLWAWLDTLDKKHSEDGLISGVISLAADLGWTVGPVLAGIFYVTLGPSIIIVIGSLFIFAAWLLALVTLSRYKGPILSPLPYSMPARRRHKH